MIKYCLVIFNLIILFSSKGQQDIYMYSQSDVNSFNSALSIYNGSIFIHDTTTTDPVVNLNSLSNLVSITGAFQITNTSLVNLNALSNLTSIGLELNIGAYNDQLQNIDSLSNLTSVGSISIGNNLSLINLNGLSNITSIVDYISVVENYSLEDINGLSEITSVANDLEIQFCENLTNLDGLYNLFSIGNNLTITNNNSLTNCCGIQELLNTPGAIAGNITINSNPTECNSPFYISTTYCSVHIFLDSLYNVDCLTDSGFITVHADFGTPPYTFLWNTGATDTFIYPVSDGIYSVTVIDALGDSSSVSAILSGSNFTSGFDLNSNIITTPFQSGFNANILLDTYNSGCNPTSGKVKIILDSLLQYNSAVPPPNLISGDTLIWNFSNLYYSGIHLQPSINVGVSINASIGDNACIQIITEPIIGDNDTSNNNKQYCFPIVNAYDPNDKQVYPQGICSENYTTKESLTYTIRFQNTGNADAVNIFILDTIDNYLNAKDFRLVSTSHEPLIIELIDSNIFKFIFDNINLPDSNTNFIGSQGFVIFEFDSLSHLNVGTIISNSSSIYFDYNEPVHTNTVFNTLVDQLPSPIHSYDSLQSCDSVFFMGNWYTSSQNLVHFFTTTNGCDSVLNTTLTINNSTFQTVHIEACDSIAFNGISYFSSQSIVDTFSSINGCDSIIQLNITIYNSVHNSLDYYSCDSIELNGLWYYSTQQISDTLITSNGCDSIIVYNIIVDNNISTIVFDTILSNESYILPNGTIVYQTGIYYDTLNTTNICDSIIITNLIVKNNVGNFDNKVFDFVWLIFPNPASNSFTLEVIDNNKGYSIEIYNTLGQIIYSKNIDEGKNKIESQDWTNGIYSIVFKDKAGMLMGNKKVVISKDF